MCTEKKTLLHFVSQAFTLFFSFSQVFPLFLCADLPEDGTKSEERFERPWSVDGSDLPFLLCFEQLVKGKEEAFFELVFIESRHRFYLSRGEDLPSVSRVYIHSSRKPHSPLLWYDIEVASSSRHLVNGFFEIFFCFFSSLLNEERLVFFSRFR